MIGHVSNGRLCFFRKRAVRKASVRFHFTMVGGILA